MEPELELVSGVELDEIRLQALFSYYGGKHNLAVWILENMPWFRHFIEGCGGSLAVFLAMKLNPKCAYTVNDINGDITNFYRVMRGDHRELWRQLRYTMYSRQEMNDCRVIPATGISSVERARRWFVGQQMSFSGMRTGFSNCVQAQPLGPPNRAISRYRQYLKQVALFSKKLRRAQIETMDILKLISVYDRPDALFYFDPPYVPDTRVAPKVYVKEQGLEFHVELVKALLKLNGGCVLSGYAHPVYDPLVDAGWIVKTREARLTSRKTSGGENYATETIWVRPCPEFV